MDHLNDILKHFEVPSGQYDFESSSQGLINSTYFVSVSGEKKWVLQSINVKVFERTEILMNNLEYVAPTLQGDAYHGLNFVLSRSGGLFHLERGQYWRLMRFVEGSLTYDNAPNLDIAREAGKLIGLFHLLVLALDPSKLGETLPGFHNFKKRYAQFQSAIAKGRPERIKTAKLEIALLEENSQRFLSLNLEDLPRRICHNDTKLNNMLFDAEDGGLCLIDLDTLMPGTLLYDTGDALRTIVNPAPEGSTNIADIDFQMDKFEAFTRGMKSSALVLHDSERLNLPLSVALMPFLHALRALTDYLMGDIYYKVSRPDENYDRARSLLHFALLALEKEKDMKACLERVFA